MPKKTAKKKKKFDLTRIDFRIQNLLEGLEKARAGMADDDEIKQIGRDGFEIYAYVDSYLSDL